MDHAVRSAAWRFSLLVCLPAVLPACGGSTGPDSPPVASVRVTPDVAVLDLGGTTRLTATALSEAGDPIPGAAITWQSTGPGATVDATGLVTGVSPGTTQVTASSDGFVGRAEVRVSPVAAMTPDTGRYGALVTLTGDDVLADAVVRFTGPDGDPIPAIARSAAPGSLQLWVPVDARTGPLTVEWPGGSGRTAAEFRLTADADILAGGATVPFPYRNPSLRSDAAEPHAIAFTVTEPGPFALQLQDRGPANGNAAVRAWLFRTDVEPSTLVAFLMTRDLAVGGVLDSVTYSRTELAAGDYTVIVAPLDLDAPERTDLTRAFGLRLEAAERFGRAPDAREPNDYPAEAPAVALPTTGDDAAGLGFETPYGMDHYAIEVDQATTIRVATGAPDGLVLAYLFPAGITDILEAWETDQVLAAADGTELAQSITVDVPPGRYTVLTWDWGGGARPYDLEITTVDDAGMAAPSVTAVPARPPAPLRPPWRPAPTRHPRR